MLIALGEYVGGHDTSTHWHKAPSNSSHSIHVVSQVPILSPWFKWPLTALSATSRSFQGHFLLPVLWQIWNRIYSSYLNVEHLDDAYQRRISTARVSQRTAVIFDVTLRRLLALTVIDNARVCSKQIIFILDNQRPELEMKTRYGCWIEKLWVRFTSNLLLLVLYKKVLHCLLIRKVEAGIMRTHHKLDVFPIHAEEWHCPLPHDDFKMKMRLTL